MAEKTTLRAKTDKVAIFDLDGTLVYPAFRLKVLSKFLNDQETNLSKEIPKSDLVQLKQHLNAMIEDKSDNLNIGDIKNITKELLKNIIQDDSKEATYLKLITKELSSVIENEEYTNFIKTNTRLLPNAEKILKTYQEKGFELALVTNQKQKTAKEQLEALGISKYFKENIYGSTGNIEEAKIKTPHKPNPKLAQDALSAMNTSSDATVIFHGDSIKDLLLNPDKNETRKISNQKLVNARNQGVEGYRNFKMVLLNPEPNEEIINAMTPTEFIEYDKATKDNSNERYFGQRLSWYKDTGEFVKNLERNIDAETERNQYNKAYINSVKDLHDGDIPLHLHPNNTIIPGEQDSLFVEQFARATAYSDKINAVSYRNVATYTPVELAFHHAAVETMMQLQFDKEEDYIELTRDLYQDYIVDNLDNFDKKLIKNRSANIKLAYEILQDIREQSDLSAYEDNMVTLIIEVKDLVKSRENEYRHKQYPNDITNINDSTDLIIAHTVANRIYDEQAEKDIKALATTAVKNATERENTKFKKIPQFKKENSESFFITGGNGNGKTSSEIFVRALMDSSPDKNWNGLLKTDYDHLGEALISSHELSNPASSVKVRRELTSTYFKKIIQKAVLEREGSEMVSDVLFNNFHPYQKYMDALLSGGGRVNIVAMTVSPQESIVRVHERNKKTNIVQTTQSIIETNKQNTKGIFERIKDNVGRNMGIEIANNEVPFGTKPEPIAYIDAANNQIYVFDIDKFKDYFKKSLASDPNPDNIDKIDNYLAQFEDDKKPSAADIADDLIYPQDIIRNPEIVEEKFLAQLNELMQDYTINIMSPNLDTNPEILASIDQGSVQIYGKNNRLNAISDNSLVLEKLVSSINNSKNGEEIKNIDLKYMISNRAGAVSHEK